MDHRDFEKDTLYLGLTRPAMMGGVTYEMFVLNAVIFPTLFILFDSWAILLIGGPMAHGLCVLICRHDPNFFRVIAVRVLHFLPTKNRRYWKVDSHRPY